MASWASDVLPLFVELARVPSPSGEERAVADRVIGYLRDLGLPVEEDGAGTVVGSSAGNLVARSIRSSRKGACETAATRSWARTTRPPSR
jgi:acetylornithine deacetylase/succinyl-diaminopimelate desuccinylase-like protein